MLTVDRLSFRHAGSRRDILKEVSFNLPEGAVTAVLGPNGSGKTTLFKCLAGTWHPYRGSIALAGQDITKFTPAKRARMIAVVPQEHEPPFPYSVLEAVLLGRTAYVSLFAAPTAADYQVAREAIATVGISHLQDQPYTRISGGERQLTLVARALAQETPLLLLDEPTSHLDLKNQTMVMRIIRQVVRQKGLTVLMTLHDPNLASLYAGQAVLLTDGQVFAAGAPQTVITSENLMRMYAMELRLISENGTSCIVPKVEV